MSAATHCCPPWSTDCYVTDDIAVHTRPTSTLQTVVPDPVLTVQSHEIVDLGTGESLRRVVLGIGREYAVLDREHVLAAIDAMTAALNPDAGRLELAAVSA